MISGGKVRVVRFFSKALVGAQLRWSVTLGKRVSENYRNLSECVYQVVVCGLIPINLSEFIGVKTAC